MAIPGTYADADVVKLDDGRYRMYYSIEPEVPGNKLEVYSSVSRDGVQWTRETGVRREFSTFPDVVRLPDGRWRMYFQNAGVIKSAVSSDGLAWQEETGVRVGLGGHDDLDDDGVAAPSTVRLADDTYLMVYRTNKKGKSCPRSPNQFTSFLFFATSSDGLNFEKKGLALDSRNDRFCDLLDGPELVLRGDGKPRLFFWSHDGVYESVFDKGSPPKPELVLSFASLGFRPGDPTVIQIGDEWFMYYGSHRDGIHYAIQSR